MALEPRDAGQVGEPADDGDRVSELPPDNEALFQESSGAGEAALLLRADGRRIQSDGDASPVIQLAVEAQGLLEESPSGRRLPGQNSRREERPRSHPGVRRRSREVQELSQPFAPLGQVLAPFPELKQRAAQAKAPVRFPMLDQPIESRPEVVVLDLELVEPFRSVLDRPLCGILRSAESPAPLRSVVLREDDAVGGMRSPRQGLLPARRQPLQTIFTNRFEHDEAGLSGGWLDLLQQALVHQRVDPLEQVEPEVAFRVADRLRCLERAPPDEDRKPSEELLLRRSEKIVAPIDRAPERLLTRRQVPRAPCQQLQTLLQARSHGGRGKQLDSGGGKLDGEGQTIQARADLGNCDRILLGHREVRLDRGGAMEEKTEGITTRQLLESPRGGRDRQRRNGIFVFADRK